MRRRIRSPAHPRPPPERPRAMERSDDPAVARGGARRGPGAAPELPGGPRLSARFLLWPMAFSCAAWWAAAGPGGPAAAAAALPDPGVWWLLGTARRLLANGPRELLPRDAATGFALGELAEKLRTNERLEADVLAAARGLLEAPLALTREDLLVGVPAAAKAAAAGGGLFGRLASAFSLVNVASTVAVAGIALSVGPSIALIAMPLWSALLKRARAAARLIARAGRPLVEALAWALLAYALLAAERFRGSENAHHQVALAACVLAWPLFFWSLARHPPLIGPDGLGVHSSDRSEWVNEILASTFGLWATSYLGPAAVMYDTKALGTAAVAGLFSALGLMCVPTFFGFAVGWRSKRRMEATRVSSVVLLATFYVRDGPLRGCLFPLDVPHALPPHAPLCPGVPQPLRTHQHARAALTRLAASPACRRELNRPPSLRALPPEQFWLSSSQGWRHSAPSPWACRG